MTMTTVQLTHFHFSKGSQLWPLLASLLELDSLKISVSVSLLPSGLCFKKIIVVAFKSELLVSQSFKLTIRLMRGWYSTGFGHDNAFSIWEVLEPASCEVGCMERQLHA